MKEFYDQPAVAPAPAINVVVRDADVLMSLGAVRVFARYPRLRVLTPAERDHADVLVAVEPEISRATLEWLRGDGDRHQEPPARGVLVTDHLPDRDLLNAVECGVTAVLALTGLSIPNLLRTVLAVHSGEGRLPPHLQGRLLAHLHRMRRHLLEPNNLTTSGLTTEERDLLRLVAEGSSFIEMAAALHCSERKVKAVLYGLMKRHGLRTRAQAVAYGFRTGVI